MTQYRINAALILALLLVPVYAQLSGDIFSLTLATKVVILPWPRWV